MLRKLNLSDAIVLVLYCLVASVSVFLLKKIVMKLLGKISLSNILRLIPLNLPLITLALISYVLSFSLWIIVIRQVPLTIAIPFQLACLTVVGFLIDRKYAGDKFSIIPIFGILTILIGILILLLSEYSHAK